MFSYIPRSIGDHTRTNRLERLKCSSARLFCHTQSWNRLNHIYLRTARTTDGDLRVTTTDGDLYQCSRRLRSTERLRSLSNVSTVVPNLSFGPEGRCTLGPIVSTFKSINRLPLLVRTLFSIICCKINIHVRDFVARGQYWPGRNATMFSWEFTSGGMVILWLCSFLSPRLGIFMFKLMKSEWLFYSHVKNII